MRKLISELSREIGLSVELDSIRIETCKEFRYRVYITEYFDIFISMGIEYYKDRSKIIDLLREAFSDLKELMPIKRKVAVSLDVYRSVFDVNIFEEIVRRSLFTSEGVYYSNLTYNHKDSRFEGRADGSIFYIGDQDINRPKQLLETLDEFSQWVFELTNFDVDPTDIFKSKSLR